MRLHSFVLAAVVATTVLPGAAPFDGIYTGSASIVTPNVFCYGPPLPMQVAVSDGDVIRRYEIHSPSSVLSDPYQILKVPVAPDGRFHGTLNVLVGHMTWLTITLQGQIAGSHLTAKEDWPLCSFRWSLKKVPASS